MPKPITKNQLTEFWLSEFIVTSNSDSGIGHCGLCGNKGIIDTVGIKTPAGSLCGGQFFCICPNGRDLKKIQIIIDNPE